MLFTNLVSFFNNILYLMKHENHHLSYIYFVIMGLYGTGRKEKILVVHIFCFSHNVFYLIKERYYSSKKNWYVVKEILQNVSWLCDMTEIVLKAA